MKTFTSTGIELIFSQCSKHKEGSRAKLLSSALKILPLAFSLIFSLILWARKMAPTSFQASLKLSPLVQFFSKHIEMYHSIKSCKTSITLISKKTFLMFGYMLHGDYTLPPVVVSFPRTTGHVSAVFISYFILKLKIL